MYLLDTNVVSELRKLSSGRVDPLFVSWANQLDVRTFYLSVITIQEIEIGFLRLDRYDKQQAALLRDWFINVVLLTFADRILPIDLASARRSAQLHVPSKRPVRDTLIASTAYVHNLTVVTRNISDFKDAGIRILNPWSATA